MMNDHAYSHLQAILERLKLLRVPERLDQLAEAAAKENWTSVEFLDRVLDVEVSARVERDVTMKTHLAQIIDEDLGKSGAQAEARGGFQHLLAEISLARAGLVLSFDASRLARNNRDWYQLRAASAQSSARSSLMVNDSTIRDSTTIDYCWGCQA
jgi:hypothetical protein